MYIFKTYFDEQQFFLLVAGGLLFFISLILQNSKYRKFAVVFLGLSAFCIFCFAALLDPFLNIWDERFHALVAKNMMSHPLMPTLYDNPLLQLNSNSWDQQHIWLHKQPLFLWQIVLSFRLFGISEFSLRLPSVVLAVVFVLVAYRCGKLLVNQRTGYLSAVMVMSTLYITGLISGRRQLDHNDISFIAYVSFSIWSFLEYQHSGKKRWIYLIGLFSGMAVLCKWLVGLLVYLGWISFRIMQRKIRLRENLDFFISLLITVIVALPWQILTFLWYPHEAAAEMKYNSSHFFHVIEGHGGNFWYHFNVFDSMYGAMASFFVIPSFLVLYRRCKNKKLFFMILIMVVAVYLFFSLAATKMPSFTFVVAMIVFIGFASFMDYLLTKIEQSIRSVFLTKMIAFVAVLSLIILRYDVEFLQKEHTLWKESNLYSRAHMQNKKVFSSLNLPANAVLCNVKGMHYIEAMFYSGLPAYGFIPSLDQYLELKKNGKVIAVFSIDQSVIPDYLSGDSTVIFLKDEIVLCQ